jgi:uncharacterized protein
MTGLAGRLLGYTAYRSHVHIPAEKEIRSLHERYAPSPAVLDLVWTHSLIVRDIATQLMPPNTDADLVTVGCLLHDVGVYRLAGDDYIRHGILGHELLHNEGFPETLCRFASRHTGVGLTTADIIEQNLPIPPGDYTAQTPEETLVMYADKFHSKTNPPRFLTARAYAQRIRRFGADKEAAFLSMVSRFGEPDLTTLGVRYGHGIVVLAGEYAIRLPGAGVLSSG